MKLQTFLEVEIEVEFTYHRAIRGRRDSCGGVSGAGPALEPDEPEHVEITSVRFQGHEVELDAADRERIEGLCLEHATAQEPD